MLARIESDSPELRLLLACARVDATEEDEAAIRQILAGRIDWTLFVRKAMDHGLAGVAGHTLARVAADMVPGDLLDAFHMNIERTREKNRLLFIELNRLIQGLANAGIETIPFKGPVIAIQAYGDLGLRDFRDLDFLIRDPDLEAALRVLCDLGYTRAEGLNPEQLRLIHRIQGQEIMRKEPAGFVIEPHTRLTSVKMAIDIDYAGLWRRAKRTYLNGQSILTLAPEDGLLILAIHGCKEMWWRINWACDLAAFIASNPNLDWTAIIDRARAQGCLRMVLLATSLARKYFNSAVPAALAAAEQADPAIEPMVAGIVAHWRREELAGPPSYKTLSMDRLRLHDGMLRRARFTLRTWFLPGPHHVAGIPLPRSLAFAYVPIKIAHDTVALPLWRAARHLGNALARSDLALAGMPRRAETRSIMKQHRRARADAKRALAVDPNNLTAWRNLGNALFGLKRFKQAIACYDKALVFAPGNPAIWKKRGAAMAAIGKRTDVPNLALDSEDAHAWVMAAGQFWSSQRFADAVEASDRALALDPKNVTAARLGIQSRLFACDWHRREEDKRRIAEGLRAGQQIIAPVFHRTLCDSEAESLVLAQLPTRGYSRSTPIWQGETYRHGKIRIAYISTDFRDHVVSDAIAGCLEQHDKTRFELTAVSLGPDDGSQMRQRIEAAFDRFIDAQTMTDAQVATMLRRLEIDIAIDLNGNSGEKRSGILFHRPAPLQVNYLGYPGTMGVPFIDYIIADRVVIPEEHQIHYSEKVVYLPHTYMPHDSKRAIGDKTPSRIEAGLPERGFVFACHNAAHKISPEMFDIWMRLLGAVEGSVLWLRSLNPAAVGNLWHEAKTRGVAPERLIFAPRVPLAQDHLARLRLADLFLDTLPYNAHATACAL